MITDFGTKIDQYLTNKAAEDNRDQSYFHPSNFGGCLVEVWLKMMGEKPVVPVNASSVRIFDNGHFVHLRNQIYAKEAGVLAYDTVEKVNKPEEITIGLNPQTRIKIEGTSGREYYYHSNELIWRVDKPKKHCLDIYIGTDYSPFWDLVDTLKPGDKWWMVEIPIVDFEHHFGGHCDAIIVNDGVETVIDYKGISDYRWAWAFYDKKKQYLERMVDKYNSSCFICGKNMRSAKDLSAHMTQEHLDEVCLDFQYNIQLHVYMMALGLDNALLWYENKNNQITIDWPVNRDEKIVDKTKKNATILWQNILDKKKPKRQPEYERGKFPCSYCDYAFQCWND